MAQLQRLEVSASINFVFVKHISCRVALSGMKFGFKLIFQLSGSEAPGHYDCSAIRTIFVIFDCMNPEEEQDGMPNAECRSPTSEDASGR